MVKKAKQRKLALQFGVLVVLFISRTAIGAPMDSRPADREGLYQYLEHMGIELDCYFTIEEIWDKRGKSIDCLEIEGDKHVAGIDQLVVRLNEQLQGVHVFRSNENPAVVHLVDIQLENENGYALTKRVSVNYSGDVQGLVDQLHSRDINSISSQDMFLTSGFGLRGNDRITQTKCSAHGLPVRRVLSDFVPLSQYGRILWVAASRVERDQLETKIQYLGSTSGPIWFCIWKDPVTFEQHYLGEPRVNGLFPFDAGEVAYANNNDDLKTYAQDDLVRHAAAFIDERLDAGKPLQVRWAMLYLGKRKAEEGIPTLLKHLDYRYTTCGLLEESYPAVRALTQIGKAAAEAALVELLTQDESPLRCRLLKHVVNSVPGVRLTRGLVQGRLEQAKDEAEKGRLRRLLEFCFDEGD